jgi:hypothetical protein
MQRTRSALVPALAAALFAQLAAPLAAQQRTLVVDAAAGPFFDLPDAVAASRPGDRIEIHGAPAPYSATTISHGLDLDASAGAQVASLTIQNLAAIHAVRVEGLAVVGGSAGFATYSVQIVNCQGQVHLHRLGASRNLRVSSSTRVLITDSSIQGLDSGLLNGSALELASAAVVAVRTVVQAWNGGSFSGNGDRGQNGIGLSLGALALIDCTIQGGRGGVAPFCGSFGSRPGDGGDAVAGTGSVIAVGATALRGGQGGTCGLLNGSSGAALAGTAGLRAAPAVQFAGTTATPPLPIAEPPALASATQLQQGSTANLAVAAAPQSIVLLGFDLWHDVQPLPGCELPILLPLVSAALGGIAVTDATGQASFAFPLPSAPWIANQFTVFQAAVFDGSGALQLSTPGVARIR